MPNGPVRSILSRIKAATLKHLCLDRVVGYTTQKDENGREKRRGDGTHSVEVIPRGLLRTLTGRCTALETLILRRMGQVHRVTDFRNSRAEFDETAEEASYTEWASFIGSVRATVKEFTFDHISDVRNRIGDLPFTVMDERFLRLVLPTIVSGNWPCLTMMKLRGVRTLNGFDGKIALTKQLEAILGRDVQIVVEETIGHWS